MFFKQLVRTISVVLLIFVSLHGPFASAQMHNNGFAVAIIDMQEGFYRRGGTTDSQGLHDLVMNQMKLLEWAVKQQVPVLVFEYQNFGATDPRLMQIIANHPHQIIQKITDGAFSHPMSKKPAMKILKEWNVDTLIVAGINGPYCVLETVKGALQSGFSVMTTSWLIGNINQNPPTFPNGTWYFNHLKFVVFPTLDSIIQ